MKPSNYELMIFTPGGKCLKHYRYNSNCIEEIDVLKNDLRCGYLSAFSHIGDHFHAKKLTQIQFENITYYFIRSNDLMACLCYNNETHDLPGVKKFLSEVVSSFYSKYKKVLEDWGGDLGVFSTFLSPEIKKTLSTNWELNHVKCIK